MLEKNKIYHGDCLEVMKDIDDNSIDAVIVDPPYGTTACKWDVVIPIEPMWTQIRRITKERSPIVIFNTEPFGSVLRTSNLKMYKYDWIWKKERPTGFLNVNKQPLRDIENISVYYKKQCVYNPVMRKGFKPYVKNATGNIANGVYRINKSVTTISNGERHPVNWLIYKIANDKKMHPSEKPVKLLEYLIKTYSNKGNLILDFACGSGTTAIACQNLGRDFILIEKDKKYFEGAKKRLNENPLSIGFVDDN